MRVMHIGAVHTRLMMIMTMMSALSRGGCDGNHRGGTHTIMFYTARTRFSII